MVEPIRILHVFGRLDRGGAETMVMNLYRHIDRQKVQFDFVICTEDDCDYTAEIMSLGGRIYSIPRFGFKTAVNYIKAWRRFFAEHKEYRIIHGHLRSTASIYLSMAKRCGLKTIAHSHSTSSGVGFSAFVKNILQYPIRYIADYLIACSDEAGMWLYGKKVNRRDNYFVLNNAIDTNEYIFRETKRQAVRNTYQLDHKFVIGHVGSFKPVKNHEFMIDIFREVRKKTDQAVLMLVGEGELKADIERKAFEAGLMDSVIFTGVSTEIPALLQAMDVFLFPSLWEGLPVTLIEAQASGLRCLISDTISKKSSVTDLIEYFSLKHPAEVWADKLLQYAHTSVVRRDMTGDIKNTGYDIGNTGRQMEGFYLALADRR